MEFRLRIPAEPLRRMRCRIHQQQDELKSGSDSCVCRFSDEFQPRYWSQARIWKLWFYVLYLDNLTRRFRQNDAHHAWTKTSGKLWRLHVRL